MTYQEIINFVSAGFTKNDISMMIQASQQVQPQQVQPQQVQPQQVLPQQVRPQQVQPQQVQPQQVQPQQVLPQQVLPQQVQPQQVQPQQVQPQQVQPQQTPQVQPRPTQSEADMLAIIQRINATQAGLDIPPARTSSDILSDQLMEMFDSNRNSQTTTPSPDQKGK